MKQALLAIALLVNLNTATIAELDTLPGIGPATAARIVDCRPYTNPEDLARVKGIGPKKLAALLPLITTKEETK